MSAGREIPVSNIDYYADYYDGLGSRQRYDAIAGQLSFDWTLPPDDSLKTYRANLRALGKIPTAAESRRANTEAAHPARFGHKMDRMPSGKCRICNRNRVFARHRAAAGIPLDLPKMTKAEAGRQRVARQQERAA